MNPTIRIETAKVLRSTKGHPYRIAVVFSDGTKGTTDVASIVKRHPQIADPKMFARVRVERGALEWPCDVGIAPEAIYALAHGLPKPVTDEQARANELEMSLRELRRLVGMNQTKVASDLKLTQAAISQLELQDDHRLSTLRRYVAALGAELEVVAVLGDKRIALRGV